MSILRWKTRLRSVLEPNRRTTIPHLDTSEKDARASAVERRSHAADLLLTHTISFQRSIRKLYVMMENIIIIGIESTGQLWAGAARIGLAREFNDLYTAEKNARKSRCSPSDVESSCDHSITSFFITFSPCGKPSVRANRGRLTWQLTPSAREMCVGSHLELRLHCFSHFFEQYQILCRQGFLLTKQSQRA